MKLWNVALIVGRLAMKYSPSRMHSPSPSKPSEDPQMFNPTRHTDAALRAELARLQASKKAAGPTFGEEGDYTNYRYAKIEIQAELARRHDAAQAEAARLAALEAAQAALAPPPPPEPTPAPIDAQPRRPAAVFSPYPGSESAFVDLGNGMAARCTYHPPRARRV
jgi:hypothetical protein